jgi:hypothetical protein
VTHQQNLVDRSATLWSSRVNGVQHPAPPLKCLVDRTPDGVSVPAQYALAHFNGRNVTSKSPKTEIWYMLYAQVKQADAAQNRNSLVRSPGAVCRVRAVQPGDVPCRTIQANKFANSFDVNLDAQPRESPAGRRATSSNYWINSTWLTPPA